MDNYTLTEAFRSAIIEEFTTSTSELLEFTELIASFRDSYYINVFNRTNMQDFWMYVREKSQDQRLGRLTYRFFLHLAGEKGTGVNEALAAHLSHSLCNIYVFKFVDDVNRDRLPKKQDTYEFLLGNPWLMFSLVAENNLALLFTLLSDLAKKTPTKPQVS